MCQVTKEEMLQSLPVIISADAVSYFASKVQGFSDCEEATNLLRQWYNSDENRARILSTWQRMKLSEELSKAPDSSEVVIFQKFLARLMSLKKQLPPNYQSEEFLRVRLLSAEDIPHV